MGGESSARYVGVHRSGYGRKERFLAEQAKGAGPGSMEAIPRYLDTAVAIPRRSPSRRTSYDAMAGIQDPRCSAGSTPVGEVQAREQRGRARDYPGGDWAASRVTGRLGLAVGQSSASVQPLQLGTRARHTRRPCAIKVMCSDPRSFLGITASRLRPRPSFHSPVEARPSRCATRHTCVSTGRTSLPNA